MRDGPAVRDRRQRGPGRTKAPFGRPAGRWWCGTLALLSGILGSCRGGDGVMEPTSRVCTETAASAELSLGVGESRRVEGDGAQCFTIQRDGAQYALTVVNLGRVSAEDAPLADCIAFVRLVDPVDAATAEAGPPCGVMAMAVADAVGSARRARPTRVTGGGSWQLTGGAGERLPPTVSRDDILDRLRSAQVGDSVWMPDRFDVLDVCSLSPASIPVFEAVVVAIEGNSVIAVDTRFPNIGAVLAPDGRAKLDRVAATLDAVYLPTMRVVVSNTFQPPGGAGGRIVTLFTDIGGLGTVLYPEASPRSWCEASIEVSIALLGLDVAVATEAQIAGIALHEHSHGADYWIGPLLRRDAVGTTGWATEALAATAQEQAARILAGARVGFRQGPDEPGGLAAEWPATRWGQPRPEISPLWGPRTVPGAAYTTGGLFLLFVREQIGETWPDGGGGLRLYERVAATGNWSLEGIASAVQMESADLYDRFALAVAMDDRLPPDVAPTTSLPQFVTWDNSWRRDDDPDGRWRLYESPLEPTSFDVPLAVGVGTYGIWRIDASPGEEDAGVFGLHLAPARDRPPAIIRITRYR